MKWERILSVLFVLFFLSVSASPALAVEQRVEIKQKEIPGTNLAYTTNFTDFRDTLPWPETQNGIYMGPHLPCFKYRFNKMTADVLVYFNFTLDPSTFLYGAGEYYLYIPILNAPYEVRMRIKIDNTVVVAMDPVSADNVNFEDALKYGILQYSPDHGYLLHALFVPLRTGMNHTVEVLVSFKTDTSLRVLLPQEIPHGTESTDLLLGEWLGWKMKTLEVYHSSEAVPLAFAVVATSGLTSSGMYSVTIPPFAKLFFAMYASRDAYPTLNLFIEPSYTSKFKVLWKWHDTVTGTWKTATHYMKASHFIVDSADGKATSGTTAFVELQNVENVSSRVFLYLSAPSVTTPAVHLILNESSDFAPSFTGYFLNDFGFAHIAGTLQFTDERFIGLNTTYQATDAFLVRKALRTATYLYIEDAEHHLPILKWTTHAFYSVNDFKQEIAKSVAHVSNSFRFNFWDLINRVFDVLSSLGKIVWGCLLKFWNWLISGLSWIWEQLQPVLMLGGYIVSLWFVMFATTKMGALMQKRKEVSQ